MRFDYLNTRPQVWADLLSSLRGRGVQKVEIIIPWGAFEKSRGVRDFSKKPNLKLERLFTVIAETGLVANVRAGFFPGTQFFPDWVMALKPTALIPRTFLEQRQTDRSFVSLPSPFGSPEVLEEFKNFLAELNEVVELYKRPDGPVESLEFSWGIFESDVSFDLKKIANSGIASLGILNERYQTSFLTFPEFFTPQIFSTLASKRPWLAAYDFKLSRKHLLQTNPLPESIATVERAQLSEIDLPETALIIDSVPIESVGTEWQPLMPGGFLVPTLAQQNQEFNTVIAWAQSRGVPFFWTQDLLVKTIGKHPRVCYFLGTRFVESPVVAMMKDLIEKGTSVFFLKPIPVYSEKFESVSFPITRKRTASIPQYGTLTELESTTAVAWAPSTELPLSADFLNNADTEFKKRVGMP